MNIKASNKYLFSEQFKSLKVFYIIFISSVLALQLISGINVNNESQSVVRITFSGMNFTSMIYLFICGLCCFTENFAMMLQNGVSRKSHFVARVLTILQISAIMAVMDELIVLVLRWIGTFIGENYSVLNLYQIWFKNPDMPGILKFMNSVLFDFAFYVAAFSGGFLITVVFYRLNKFWRTLVGVGIPITLFVILPIVESNVTNGAISRVVVKIVGVLYNFAIIHTFNSIILFATTCIVFLTISWFTSRRAIMNT